MTHIRLYTLLLILFLSPNLSLFAQDSEIEGVWQMRGYGWIFDIDQENVTTYDISSISCLPNASYPSSMLGEYTIKDKVMTTRIGLSTYVLDRLETLPDLCGVTLSRKQKKDPLYNFEILWHTFNEQYAYFDVRSTDWEQSYKKYKPQINNNTTDAELYSIVYAMLDEIGDGHVDLEAPDKIIDKAYELTDMEDDDVSFKELWMSIAHYYVDDLKTHNYTKSVWGKINDQVGYLQVNDMAAQAYYGITPDMTKREAQKLYERAMYKSDNHMQDETDGMHRTMQKVLKDLEGVKHIILDVRFNGGGFDTVSFEIIRALTTEAFIGFKKYARQGTATTEPYLYEVTPAENAFTGTVHILQSSFSASATETMLLASMQMPNVLRVGSASEGILSDALEKVLPNGWSFYMSNEAYETPDGVNYENKGIPVDIELNYPTNDREFLNLLQLGLTNEMGDKGIEFILDKLKKE